MGFEPTRARFIGCSVTNQAISAHFSGARTNCEFCSGPQWQFSAFEFELLFWNESCPEFCLKVYENYAFWKAYILLN